MTDAFTSTRREPFSSICHLRYPVDDQSDSYPSTAKQLVLLNRLVDELKEMGVADAAIDRAWLRDGNHSAHTRQGTRAGHRLHRPRRYVAGRERRRRQAHRPQSVRRARYRPARRPVHGAARSRQPRAGRTAGQRHHHRVRPDAARFRRQVGRGRDHGRGRISVDAPRDSARRREDRLYPG